MTRLALLGLLALAVVLILAARAPHHPASKPSNDPLGGQTVWISDEKGDQILEVNGQGTLLWQAKVPPPDDLAPTPQGNLVVNSDERNLIYLFNLAQRQIIWSYGGSAQGQSRLIHPEDSFGAPGGIWISDTGHQRVIRVSLAHQITDQYGHTDVAGLLPGYLAMLNDAVPLQGGGLLITEAGYPPWHLPPTVLCVGPSGQLVWKLALPDLRYASDALPIGPDRFVVTDWSQPGSIRVYTTRGKLVWSYGPPRGPGALNHPSSAEPLLNGDFLVSDDFNDRVVVIDPRKQAIVWQYGRSQHPGLGPGALMGPTDAKASGELLPPYAPYAGAPAGALPFSCHR